MKDADRLDSLRARDGEKRSEDQRDEHEVIVVP